MLLMGPLKFYTVFIIFYFSTAVAFAEKLFSDEVPLEVDKAFVIDHLVASQNEIVVRLQIFENYYLYKEKLIFSSSDFHINDINLPQAAVKFDEFFGLSEVYYNLIEITLLISPKKNKVSNGILEVSYQGCWEGGVCYPLTKKYLHIREL